MLLIGNPLRIHSTYFTVRFFTNIITIIIFYFTFYERAFAGVHQWYELSCFIGFSGSNCVNTIPNELIFQSNGWLIFFQIIIIFILIITILIFIFIIIIIIIKFTDMDDCYCSSEDRATQLSDWTEHAIMQTINNIKIQSSPSRQSTSSKYSHHHQHHHPHLIFKLIKWWWFW